MTHLKTKRTLPQARFFVPDRICPIQLLTLWLAMRETGDTGHDQFPDIKRLWCLFSDHIEDFFL